MIVDMPLIMGPPSTAPNTLGLLSFNVSPDHDNVDYYEALLRVQGSSTVIDTLNIGKPDPNTTGIAWYDIAAWLSSHAPGNYTVSVNSVNTDGSSDSVASSAFTVPLS